MFLLWSSLALGAPACPDVPGLVVEARSAFDEAEVDQARQTLARAYDALTCQSMVVSKDSLLDLYHLDALASVADEDDKAALFAIIRAVTLDPDQAPPADVGPELLVQHGTWADRIREDRVRVMVADPQSSVWIDGQAVTDQPLDVVTGKHLVQVRRADGWRNTVAELSVRGDVGDLPILLAPVPAAVGSVVQPVDPRDPPPPTPDPPSQRRVNLGVALTGSALALVGGGLVAGGYFMEQEFDADPYNAATYGGCARADACWETERANKIGRDARRANGMYLTGYGLAGVGLGVLTMELFVLRTSGGSTGVGLKGRW